MESGADRIAAWHLLALLRTADRDWEGATKACEAGVDVWESAEQEWEAEEGTLDRVAQASVDPGEEAGVVGHDFAVTESSDDRAATRTSGNDSPPILSPAEMYPNAPSSLLPDGTLTPLPRPPRPAPASALLDRAARLQDVIALRQTLNAVLEKRFGPTHALLGHQELFAFYKARSGTSGRGRYALSGARSVADSIAGSTVALGTGRSVRGLQPSGSLGAGSVLGLDKLREGGLGMTALGGRGDEQEEVIDGSIING